MTDYNPYKVDFAFTSSEKASMVVVAESKEAAAEGALKLINSLEGYDNPEITGVNKADEHGQTQQNTSIN